MNKLLKGLKDGVEKITVVSMLEAAYKAAKEPSGRLNPEVLSLEKGNIRYFILLRRRMK